MVYGIANRIMSQTLHLTGCAIDLMREHQKSRSVVERPSDADVRLEKVIKELHEIHTRIHEVTIKMR